MLCLTSPHPFQAPTHFHVSPPFQAFGCACTFQVSCRRYVFDLLVVALSLVALGPIDVPVNVLRVLRAFRVLRMLGRLRALRRVVESVGLAVVPVLNVFAVILLVASICA